MNSQQSIGHKIVIDVAALLATQKRSDLLLFIVVFVTVFSLTPLLILAGATIGFGIILGILAALTCATLVVMWPVVGFFLVTGCVVLIEQNPQNINIWTDRLNVFYWPPQLAGLFERPIGFLMLFIFLVLVWRRLVKRQQAVHGGELLAPFLFFLLCVAGGVVHGMTSGGDLKIIIVEIRPFWYMFLSYLLAYNLVTYTKHIRTFFGL